MTLYNYTPEELRLAQVSGFDLGDPSDVRRQHVARVEAYLRTLVDSGVPLEQIRVIGPAWVFSADGTSATVTTQVRVLGSDPETIW